ncbi:hypothetical protein BOO35_01530 [Vibrio navarrensis]|nr:hypothetical protein [Vibrio navarrensis]
MIIPASLKVGDTIGFFSPSSPATVFAPERFERSFAHLKILGVFDKVAAVVLGKHELFNDKGTGRASIDVLKEVLNGQKVPILYDFDSCHTHPMLTVPLGSTMTIDFDQHKVSVSLA